MKKIMLLILFSFFGLASKIVFAQNDTVKVGVYVLNLTDFNLNDESFSIDLWAWYHYVNDSIDPIETIEFINSAEVDMSNQDLEKVNNVNWATVKYKAKINNNVNIKNFPFDNQKLNLVLEESLLTVDDLILTIDKKSTRFDSSINVSGWKIKDFKLTESCKTYNTSFGDPRLNGTSNYSRVTFSFELQRNYWQLFFKLFSCVYVAALISFMVFYINPINVDPRFGLSIGSLFATVGNKYVVDSFLPESNVITLVDKVHSITFIYILISVVLSVISLYLSENGRVLMSKKLDFFSFYFLFFTYLLINVVLVLQALNFS